MKTEQKLPVQACEVQSLFALGITSLNYAMGTFEKNGVLKQLGSPDLAADSQGRVATMVRQGASNDSIWRIAA